MKKGETYSGIVERIDYPNKGIVRIEGVSDDDGHPVCVHVRNALPGERIDLRLLKKRRGVWQAEKLATIEAGPGVREPVCPHAADCGGCVYQKLTYDAQLELKEEQVTRLLGSAIDGVWERIHPSPSQTDYRNKMEFTFGDEYKDGPLTLGLHKRGAFYDIVTAEGCRICDPDFSVILRETLSFFAARKISFYHRMNHTGYLRHLLVRKGLHSGEILVDLVTVGRLTFSGEEGQKWNDNAAGEEEKLLTEWQQALSSLEERGQLSGTLTGILHTRNDRLGDVIEDQGTEVLAGQDHFTDQVLGLTFKISPFSFFQTNTAGAEKLYEIVRDYLGDVSGKRVYDLYSGTGTIAQVLAPAAEEVIGVEIIPEAVEAAEENAAVNELANCSFLCGDVFEVLDSQLAAGKEPDVIVLDPPREGVRAQALQKILGYRAERIVYVSCQITSLARDLPRIEESGYQLTRACSVDMFPQTAGIETVAVFERRAGAWA